MLSGVRHKDARTTDSRELVLGCTKIDLHEHMLIEKLQTSEKQRRMLLAEWETFRGEKMHMRKSNQNRRNSDFSKKGWRAETRRTNSTGKGKEKKFGRAIYRAPGSTDSKRGKAGRDLPTKRGEGLRPAHPFVVTWCVQNDYERIENIAPAVRDDRARRGRAEITNITSTAIDKTR